jgi:hypothetical protein
MRAASQPFMEAGLKKSGRDQAAVYALLETFYDRLAVWAAENPMNLSYPTARVLLRRRERESWREERVLCVAAGCV